MEKTRFTWIWMVCIIGCTNSKPEIVELNLKKVGIKGVSTDYYSKDVDHIYFDLSIKNRTTDTLFFKEKKEFLITDKLDSVKDLMIIQDTGFRPFFWDAVIRKDTIPLSFRTSHERLMIAPNEEEIVRLITLEYLPSVNSKMAKQSYDSLVESQNYKLVLFDLLDNDEKVVIQPGKVTTCLRPTK